MKRYLRRLFVGGTIVVMLLNMAICSLAFFGILRDNVRGNLKAVINAFFLLETPSEAACQSIADHLTDMETGLEAVFLREDGAVIASAPGNAAAGYNPAEDHALQQALGAEWGEQVQRSPVSGEYTLYVTRRIGDGLVLRLGCPLTSINGFLSVMLMSGVLSCLLMIGALYFSSGLLMRKLVRPLQQINDLLHASHPVPAKAQGDVFKEVQPLMDNISMMICKLHYDLDEIKRTQQMRRDFVANASHELKSPLTSIKGFAELIEAGMAGSREQEREYISRIVRESDRLLSIIEAILQLNRAEAGIVENVQTVDMRAVCDEAASALESIAVKKNIHLEIAGQGSIEANPREIWELIYNLIDNGIRYGREGGFVNVRVDPGRLTVVDDGIGMAADQLPRIFERFYRVDNSHSRAGTSGMPGGTGLGLSIVKHIALKYGGDISVSSEPGEGSTFTGRLTRPSKGTP